MKIGDFVIVNKKVGEIIGYESDDLFMVNFGDRKDSSKTQVYFKDELKNMKPNSLWLVIYECRYDVVRISADGKGFFAPGQEELWGFGAVTEWIEEIIPLKKYKYSSDPANGWYEFEAENNDRAVEYAKKHGAFLLFSVNNESNIEIEIV